jgi:hypothetical protein
LKKVIVDLSISCLLLVVVGVCFVSADYWDGYDWAHEWHGDNWWANSADVTAWYCAPRLYWKEEHSAFSWATWPEWVTDCIITFTGKYYDQIKHQETWHTYNSLSKTKSYNDTCTVARTYIDTSYFNGLTGDRWEDGITVVVMAGTSPG